MEAAKPRLKPRTFHSYELMYSARIIPEFGSRRITSVTRADVQAWINKLSGKGLAPATVHHCYVALRKVMKHALWDRQIAFNPCDGIELPRAHDVDEGALAALTYAQVEAAAAQLAFFQPYDVLVRFMAYTGLRAGEVAGLRVRDIDLAAGHVSVRQTAQHIKGEWVFGTPKSRRSSRDVPLLDRRLIADFKAHKMQHPRSGNPDALFWPGRTPGSHRVDYGRVWDLASFRRNYFKPALARAELPAIRVHDLRHTAASLWLAAGFPPYQVSRWLGHASVVTTDTIYSHLYPTDYAQHIARFERFAAER
ncbi:tyrosine-type recombinase/integrase [Sphingomonas sp. BLCC-B65]|nr:tyrosine-type recombinase/integrase [Sphingomonas sp. BLCC-B65]